MDDLTRLAVAARDGDRAALTRFVRLTQADVYRFCAYIRHPSEAEDLTQETYARALGALGRFKEGSSARTWLLAIAKHVAIDAGRRQASFRRLVGRVARQPEPVHEPGGAAHVHDLLAGLEPDRRAAFTLTQMLGLSYAEAAEVIGCPIGTIRSRVARAREDLVDALRDADQAGTG